MKLDRRLLIAALGMCCAATPVEAQSSSMRPYRAIFGGASQEAAKHRSLDVTATLAEGYDDNVLADINGGSFQPTSALQTSGTYTQLSTTGTYTWRTRTMQFVANGGLDARYYQPSDTFLFLNRYLGGGLSAQLSERVQLIANQSVSFMPSQFYALLPTVDPSLGDVTGAGSDFSLNKEDAYVSNTEAQLRYGLSTRSSFVFLGGYRASSYPNLTLARGLRSYSVGGRYEHVLSRWSTLHLGYVHEEGEFQNFASTGPTVVHDIDVGVDYHRPLSFSRHTRLDFGVGSAIVTTPVSSGSEQELQYRVQGNANLSHDFGRTWRASVAYNRGVGFIEALGRPAFSDGVQGVVQGFFSRRVDFQSSAGLSKGDVNGARTSQSNFAAYTATARLRVGINSHWAAYTEYVFYYYDVGEALFFPNNLPSTLHRNTVRVGLTTWASLLRR